MNPLTKAAKRNTNHENLAVAIGCGIVLAGLVLAFVIRATN